jgi:preprotein translocase subunit SecA
MDYLREGIGLRAMAQRDPLIEYQREGFDMFSAMMDGIKEEAVGYLFNVQVAPVEATTRPGMALQSSQPQKDATEPAAAEPPAAPEGAPAAPTGKRGRHATPPSDVSGPPTDPNLSVPSALRGTGVGRASNAGALRYSGPAEDGSAARQGPSRGAGGTASAPSRNQPCPCGSGRKYKHCHGAPTGARP